MNYHFSVSPYSYEYLAASAMLPISSWTISLEDNQGFKINQFTIERNSMNRNMAEDGSYTGMDIKGSITMDKFLIGISVGSVKGRFIDQSPQ